VRRCVWNPLTLSGSACGAAKASISNFRFRPCLSELELKPAPYGIYLHDACPPGMKVVQDSIFKFALYVCASCGKWECTCEEARTLATLAPYDEEELCARVLQVLGRMAEDVDDAVDDAECTWEDLYCTIIREDERAAASGRDACEAALNVLQERNQVMFREGRVHLV
jgi:hypothetical protein